MGTIHTLRMIKYVIFVCLVFDLIVARPQKLNFQMPKPSSGGGLSNFGKLGNGWSLGKIPGKHVIYKPRPGSIPQLKPESAYGINYNTGNWQFGLGAGFNGLKPNYGGFGVGFKF